MNEQKQRQDRQGRILIVDDDPNTLEILRRWLTREGYATVSADNGRACLRGARQGAGRRHRARRDDAGDGRPAGLRAPARERGAGAAIPVMLLTAKDDIETRSRGMMLGVSEYLTKPVNKLELFARLQRAAAQPRARAAHGGDGGDRRGHGEEVGRPPHGVRRMPPGRDALGALSLAGYRPPGAAYTRMGQRELPSVGGGDRAAAQRARRAGAAARRRQRRRGGAGDEEPAASATSRWCDRRCARLRGGRAHGGARARPAARRARVVETLPTPSPTATWWSARPAAAAAIAPRPRISAALAPRCSSSAPQRTGGDPLRPRGSRPDERRPAALPAPLRDRHQRRVRLAQPGPGGAAGLLRAAPRGRRARCGAARRRSTRRPPPRSRRCSTTCRRRCCASASSIRRTPSTSCSRCAACSAAPTLDDARGAHPARHRPARSSGRAARAGPRARPRGPVTESLGARDHRSRP